MPLNIQPRKVNLELFIPEKAEPILPLDVAVQVNLPQAVAQKLLAVLKGESDLSKNGSITMATFGKNRRGSIDGNTLQEIFRLDKNVCSKRLD